MALRVQHDCSVGARNSDSLCTQEKAFQENECGLLLVVGQRFCCNEAARISDSIQHTAIEVLFQDA